MQPEIDPDLPLGRAEEAADWCMRLADERLTRAEQAEFDAWIADPDNKHAFDEAILMWRAVDIVADRPEMLETRSAALDDLRRMNVRRWTGVRRRRWLPAIGAIAAVMLLVASVFVYLGGDGSIYRTGVGEREIATLSDGSKLSLDASTEVEVAMARDARQITLLTGRAKFDVAKDRNRPFSVRAGNRLIVATGTSFSVELVGGEVRVQLYEGHVETYALGEPNSAPKPLSLDGGRSRAAQALAPGRELIASVELPMASVHPIDTSRALAWEVGQLNFEDEPLPSAVERMNRYSQRKLVIADERTAGLRVNGVFQAGDTAAFVEGLTELYDVHAHETEQSVTLHSER